jgi:hypothetical protein
MKRWRRTRPEETRRSRRTEEEKRLSDSKRRAVRDQDLRKNETLRRRREFVNCRNPLTLTTRRQEEKENSLTEEIP